MLRSLGTITSPRRNRMGTLHIIVTERGKDNRLHQTLIVNAPGFYDLVRFSIDDEDGNIMIRYTDSNGREHREQVGEANILWQDDMAREN